MKTTSTCFLCLVFLLTGNPIHSQTLPMDVNKKLEATTETLITNFDEIDAKCKKDLQQLGGFTVEQLEGQEKFNALFFCTHNSRRNHIANLWFKCEMHYCGVNPFRSFSEGTETTAFNTTIEAINRAGFAVVYDTQVANSVVSITQKTILFGE